MKLYPVVQSYQLNVFKLQFLYNWRRRSLLVECLVENKEGEGENRYPSRPKSGFRFWQRNLQLADETARREGAHGNCLCDSLQWRRAISDCKYTLLAGLEENAVGLDVTLLRKFQCQLAGKRPVDLAFRLMYLINFVSVLHLNFKLSLSTRKRLTKNPSVIFSPSSKCITTSEPSALFSKCLMTRLSTLMSSSTAASAVFCASSSAPFV